MREPAKRFEDLVVWQKAHALVLGVYKETRRFPKEETYGLTRQLRRAAVSMPANNAEGFRRRGIADKVRFLNIAQASLEEASREARKRGITFALRGTLIAGTRQMPFRRSQR